MTYMLHQSSVIFGKQSWTMVTTTFHLHHGAASFKAKEEQAIGGRIFPEQLWSGSTSTSLLAINTEDHKHEMQVQLLAKTKMRWPPGFNPMHSCVTKEERTTTFVLPICLPDGSDCRLEVKVKTTSTIPLLAPPGEA